MTRPPRTLKAVPFVLESYEAELLAYATDPARGMCGKFAPYVKRLIERDRGAVLTTVPEVITPIVPVTKISPDKRAIAKGYL